MMGVGRIATSYLVNQSINWLQKNQSRLNNLQETVSVGKQIIRPSDNPLGLTQLLSVTRNMNNNEQFIKNVDVAAAELTTTDSVLNEVADLINRATELTTQGSTTTTGPLGMQSIAKEMDLMIDQLLQLSNSSLGDKFLFSGTQTDVKPYTRTGDNVTFLGTNTATNYQRQVTLADSSDVVINWLGTRIFGDSAVTTAPGPPPVNTQTGTGLFSTLVDIKNFLNAGNVTGTRSRLDVLKQNLDSLLTVQAEVGATKNRVDLTRERTRTQQDTLTQHYAGLQDIDLPKMLTDLNFQEQVHQASLSVMGRVLPQTLMDFLR
ncbi:MAG: flagellar hook-associated protein FlgL [Vampirovibrionales bacterium]